MQQRQLQKQCLIQIQKKKLFMQDNLYNLIQLKTHLQDQGILDNECIQQLIQKFIKIIQNQPNFLTINGDCTIIGDIHGQYYDFIKIIKKIGDFKNTNVNQYVLFLGDYVDRGANSVQVMTYIMAMKVNYPNNVFLLRGNHQSRCMTNTYNFMKEVLTKYNQNIYQRFMEAFDCMSLACLINKSFFCVHGGISNKLLDISKINQIDRFKQIPLQGPFCDFIWADPVQIQNGYMSQQIKFNQSRQCSIYFGKQLTQKFLSQNSVKSIIRAHEVFPQGYQRYCWSNKKDSNFPTVITLFSAPNYCGVYGNKGAIIKIQGTNFQIKQYKQQSINNKLHSYLQVFQWSIPQISRVVNQFTKAMMTSIFQVYLRDQFSNFKSASPHVRLKVLLDYIKKHTNILEMQKNSIQQSSVFHSKIQCKFFENNNSGVEWEQKERMFNRSREYFKKQHGRPESIEENNNLH